MMADIPDYIAEHAERTRAIAAEKQTAWEAHKASNPWPLDGSARDDLGMYQWVKERGE